MAKRAHVYYSGSVQGVGFRFTAEDLARQNNLTGWVKNLADGRVEIVAEGEAEPLNIFLGQIKQTLDYYIREEKIIWEPGTGEFHKFQIRF